MTLIWLGVTVPAKVMAVCGVPTGETVLSANVTISPLTNLSTALLAVLYQFEVLVSHAPLLCEFHVKWAAGAIVTLITTVLPLSDGVAFNRPETRFVLNTKSFCNSVFVTDVLPNWNSL